MEHANKGIFAVAQIETVEALRDLDAILAVKSLDSIVIGPYDLSGSMGLPGKVTHPEVENAVRRIIRKAKDAGIPVGLGCGNDIPFARAAVEMGVDWLQCGSDFSYLVAEAERLFAAVRSRG